MNGPSAVARAVHFAATLLLTGARTFQCFVAVPVLAAKTQAALASGLRIRLAWIIWVALAAAFPSVVAAFGPYRTVTSDRKRVPQDFRIGWYWLPGGVCVLWPESEGKQTITFRFCVN